MALSNAAKAGALLFLGSVQFGILLMLAEAVSPTYSVQLNYISDLGYLFHTSAPIFNSSAVVFGILAISSAYYLQRSFRWTPFTFLVTLAGVGLLGVGIFNEGSPFQLHELFSLVAFLFSGLSAIAAWKLQKVPLSYFSVILGVVTLVSLALFLPGSGSIGTSIGIGVGGLERLVVYPVWLWAIGFSGHLMGMEDRLQAGSTSSED